MPDALEAESVRDWHYIGLRRQLTVRAGFTHRLRNRNPTQEMFALMLDAVVMLLGWEMISWNEPTSWLVRSNRR